MAAYEVPSLAEERPEMDPTADGGTTFASATVLSANWAEVNPVSFSVPSNRADPAAPETDQEPSALWTML